MQIFFSFALLLAGLNSPPTPLVQASKADIHRDAYGVPHIFADDNAALFEAYGYAIAQDRLWQLELNRRAATGRLSEIFGRSMLNIDKYVRSTGYTDGELWAQFSEIDPAIAEALVAYTAGINRYVRQLQQDPKALPYEFRTLRLTFAPWRVEDSLALGTFMLRRFGEIGGSELDNYLFLQKLNEAYSEEDASAIFNELLWRNDPEAPTTVLSPEPRVPATIAAKSKKMGHGAVPKGLQNPWLPLSHAQPLWSALGVPSKLGSYAWAVSPSHSASGVAMLYGGPQMGNSAPEVVHEVQLTGPNGFSVTGMAFAGVPLVLIGYNSHLAWTSTTAVGDNVDIYVETLCDAGTGAASGTVFNDQCLPMTTRREVIEVAGDAPVPWEVQRSVHGPALVVPELNVAVAQKRAHWQKETATLAAFWRFNHAADLQEFAAGVPLVATQHNFIYADRRGNIAYWQAGIVPRRAANFDFRLPLPGDGRAEWQDGALPTPTAINPPSGYLTNWNNKPCANFDSADNHFFGRQSRLPDIEARLQGGPVSWEDMHTIASDIARITATGRDIKTLRPYLLEALDAIPPTASGTREARGLMEAWTGEGISDARASTAYLPAHVLFQAWKKHVFATLFKDVIGNDVGGDRGNVLLHALDHKHGRGALPTEYDFFAGQNVNKVLSRAFETAVLEVAQAQATGEMWPRPQVHLKHPVVGEVGHLPLSNRATWAEIVRLDPAGITAESIFSLGQSGFIGTDAPDKFYLSDHFKDLLPLYTDFTYKPFTLMERPVQ